MSNNKINPSSFTIRKPLKYCILTQDFGMNYVNFYKELGLDGHNGIDLKCYENQVFAPFDGVVTYGGVYSDGGIGIEMVSDYAENNIQFKSFFYHLKSMGADVKPGQHFIGGQPMAISDNTGKYTTGNHLHFGLKQVNTMGNTLNYNNGYKGAIDPTPYLVNDFYLLPVDKKYGQATDIFEEAKLKIKFWKLTQEQRYALQYGGWSNTEVINYSLRPIWAFLRKEEYLDGAVPEFKLSI
jgi:hypothetical protein